MSTYKNRTRKRNLFILVIFVTLSGYSCKKEKLAGYYSNLPGSWSWVSGWPDNGNKNYRLEFTKKGQYKFYNGDDKIDYGRLMDNGKLTFVSDRTFGKGHFSKDHQIVLLKNDTLCIGSESVSDFPSSVYVKM